MKRYRFLFVIGLAALCAVGTSGCRKRPAGTITPLGGGSRPPVRPASQPNPPMNVDRGNTLNDPGPNTVRATDDLIPTGDRNSFENMAEDPAYFQANAVYFDFDSAVVKASEISKLDAIAAHLKTSATDKLRVEGHCDERGTEEYNRSLGERRALALRAALANLGLDPNRVQTRSWGEDKPASPGHDESAWSKNRRGEFILLKLKP